MRYIFLFIFFSLLSCEYKYMQERASGSATFAYSIAQSGTIDQNQTFGIREFVYYLLSTSNVGPYEDLNSVTIQSVNLQVRVDEGNKATGVDIKTSVSEINVDGTETPISAFSKEQFIPLELFGQNVASAIDVELDPNGIAMVNNIIGKNLPWNEHNDWGIGTTGSIRFAVAGVVYGNIFSSGGDYAELSLIVNVRYNQIHAGVHNA